VSAVRGGAQHDSPPFIATRRFATGYRIHGKQSDMTLRVLVLLPSSVVSGEAEDDYAFGTHEFMDFAEMLVLSQR
jgi:hypothetical protein